MKHSTNEELAGIKNTSYNYGKVANWRLRNNKFNSPGKITVRFEDTQCPFCITGNLRTINGKFGKFLACTEYPKCKYTRKII